MTGIILTDIMCFPYRKKGINIHKILQVSRKVLKNHVLGPFIKTALNKILKTHVKETEAPHVNLGVITPDVTRAGKAEGIAIGQSIQTRVPPKTEANPMIPKSNTDAKTAVIIFVIFFSKNPPV